VIIWSNVDNWAQKQYNYINIIKGGDIMSVKKFNDGFLKSNGIDAHEVKEDYGCKPWGHYDIYNGDTVTIRDKQGNIKADTGMSKDEFVSEYGSTKGRGR
jgi:hypothetical protein